MLNQLAQLRDVTINAPSLSVLNTSTYYIGEEEEYVQRSPDNNTPMLLRLLKWPNENTQNADVFARIRKLLISTNLSYSVDATELATVLHNCINLQELGIINTASSNWNIASALWTSKDPFFCLEYHIESLWIKCFTGRYLEVEFLKFILTKASRLKRVVISSWDSDALKAVKTILLRAPNLEIITELEK